MTTVKTMSIILYLSVINLLATGCVDDEGVNGSGVAPATGVSITENNAEIISSQVVASVDTVQGASEGSVLLTGVSIVTTDSNFKYSELFIQQLKRMAALGASSTPDSVTSVVIPQTTEPCVNSGGSVTISWIINNDNSLSPGDTMTITFNNCSEEGSILNGTMIMTVNQVTDNFNGIIPPFTLGIDVVLQSFSVNDGGSVILANGDLSMLISKDSDGNAELVISGNSLSSSAGDVETLTNYIYDITGNDLSGDYSLDLRGTLASSVINGSVSFVTNTTFTGNDNDYLGNPTAGELWITTSIDNSQILLTAQSNGTDVEIQVDADGDGIYETLIMTTWTELESK